MNELINVIINILINHIKINLAKFEFELNLNTKHFVQLHLAKTNFDKSNKVSHDLWYHVSKNHVLYKPAFSGNKE